MITDLYHIKVSVCGVPYLSSESLSLSALLKVVEYAAEIYEGLNWTLEVTVDHNDGSARAENVIHFKPYETPNDNVRTAALIDLDDYDGEEEDDGKYFDFVPPTEDF